MMAARSAVLAPNDEPSRSNVSMPSAVTAASTVRAGSGIPGDSPAPGTSNATTRRSRASSPCAGDPVGSSPPAACTSGAHSPALPVADAETVRLDLALVDCLAGHRCALLVHRHLSSAHDTR